MDNDENGDYNKSQFHCFREDCCSASGSFDDEMINEHHNVNNNDDWIN